MGKAAEIRWGKFAVVVAATNTAAAVSATLLFGWFGVRFDPHELRHVFAATLVYSFSIGTPTSFAMTLAANRVAGLKLQVRLLAVSAALLTGAAGGSLAGTAILAASGILPHAWSALGFVLRMVVVLALPLGIAAFFFENLYTRLRQKELDEERALKLAAEARLSALQARMQPHFLFNTLNSIASLIPDDPARAEELIGRLSVLLRVALEADQSRLVRLSDELKIVRDYLDIEQTRFGSRLQYSFDIQPGVDATEVPPLAVQCLVENSVRHAICASPDGGEVTVSAHPAGACLAVEVADSGPGFQLENAPHGHAVENLTSRLSAIFGTEATLETERRDGRFVVRLRLPSRL